MRHDIATCGGALAFTVTVAFGATGSAQERVGGYLAEPIAAPSDALELKVGTGYTQGFGNIAPGRRLADVAGPGMGVSAEADYRLSRPWSLGIEGQYQELSSQQNASARGMAANLGLTYHFDPVVRGDPWARLGTGYRLLWENGPLGTSDVTVLRHGFELVAAKVGYDVRVSEDVALAPVLGADLNLFVWEDGATSSHTHGLSTAQVGTFLYAGLQGRFDIGGSRGGTAGIALATGDRDEQLGVTELQGPAPPAPMPAESPKPISPSLGASEDILRACQLNLGAVEKAPKFDFDDSDLLPADEAMLQQIGECFATGPMKGQGLRLVGRADPRGTVAYNEALGLRRAQRVASYLERMGVQPDQIESTSRGKLDASGRDASTWAIDRRVDVVQRAR